MTELGTERPAVRRHLFSTVVLCCTLFAVSVAMVLVLVTFYLSSVMLLFGFGLGVTVGAAAVVFWIEDSATFPPPGYTRLLSLADRVTERVAGQRPSA